MEASTVMLGSITFVACEFHSQIEALGGAY
jgi:hypothetical protein